MHLVKHRRDDSGARLFSVLAVDLVRLHAVVARLDLMPHSCRRIYRRAVWLRGLGVWQIVYLMRGGRMQDFDNFETRYYDARRAVQRAEFPGYRKIAYSTINRRVVHEPSPLYMFDNGPVYKPVNQKPRKKARV